LVILTLEGGFTSPTKLLATKTSSLPSPLAIVILSWY